VATGATGLRSEIIRSAGEDHTRSGLLNCGLALERTMAGIKAHYQLGNSMAPSVCHLLIRPPAQTLTV
jgi:hypothetical protein